MTGVMVSDWLVITRSFIVVAMERFNLRKVGAFVRSNSGGLNLKVWTHFKLSARYYPKKW